MASEAPQAPLLIVAGAGTGKTTTLTERLAHLIREGVPPQKICALTFTNKAAGEMLERVKKLIPLHGGEPLITTFHSLGARILRKEGRILGRTPNFAIFDDHDSFELIKKVLRDVEGYKPAAEKREKRSKQAPALLHQKISEIKNTNRKLDIKDAREKEDFLVIRAFPAYEKKLQENNAFDFDDLIEKVVYLFKHNPDVLAKYQNMYDAILVDEYQDVNPKQYELIRLLAGSHKNISVVGDDEQLIYGWRYANLETFLNFERDWPGAQVSLLEENYRSTGNIIAAAAAVSKNNIARRPKHLWTKNPAGEKILIIESSDENEEAETIAELIEFSVDKFGSLKVEKLNDSKNLSPSELTNLQTRIAILYRTNAQSRALEQALIRRQIPYRIFGGLKFYERKEIKDIVAGLRYAANPRDEISYERLEKTFPKKIFAELSILKGKENIPPAELIEIFLTATDYIGYLERNYSNHIERQENVTELMHFASSFATIADLLQDIALIQQTDESAKGKWRTANGEDLIGDGHTPLAISQPPVNLMTIHLAKGLEFDTVFIAGCSDGLLPHGRSLENKEQMEEERRLMYVAMTRAKKKLFISFYDMPSRFLAEIPIELTEFFVPENTRRRMAWDDEENFVTLE